MKRHTRPVTRGLRHVALSVHRFEACCNFYVHLMGMQIEWQPDEDNIYLTSGNDNLALHRAPATADTAATSTTRDAEIRASEQRLDHIGFLLDAPEEVDRWHDFLEEHDVLITQPPRTHRDGARSFYCQDPDGISVQVIYHPPLAGTG